MTVKGSKSEWVGRLYWSTTDHYVILSSYMCWISNINSLWPTQTKFIETEIKPNQKSAHLPRTRSNLSTWLPRLMQHLEDFMQGLPCCFHQNTPLNSATQPTVHVLQGPKICSLMIHSWVLKCFSHQMETATTWACPLPHFPFEGQSSTSRNHVARRGRVIKCKNLWAITTCYNSLLVFKRRNGNCDEMYDRWSASWLRLLEQSACQIYIQRQRLKESYYPSPSFLTYKCCHNVGESC